MLLGCCHTNRVVRQAGNMLAVWGYNVYTDRHAQGAGPVILGMRKTGSHVGKKKTTGRHHSSHCRAYSSRSAFTGVSHVAHFSLWLSLPLVHFSSSPLPPSLCYHSFQVVSLCPSCKCEWVGSQPCWLDTPCSTVSNKGCGEKRVRSKGIGSRGKQTLVH